MHARSLPIHLLPIPPLQLPSCAILSPPIQVDSSFQKAGARSLQKNTLSYGFDGKPSSHRSNIKSTESDKKKRKKKKPQSPEIIEKKKKKVRLTSRSLSRSPLPRIIYSLPFPLAESSRVCNAFRRRNCCGPHS